ncbi:hypothetical protein FD754_009784 [Muntiacus muntjak]|uniref:Uncharacterized protein n=1 Tax=Muntiacus muntjak TaxID=9888 RepID=A0A5N3WXN2_MUNMU|nr:hypothetical protein FD754_009784 [Muntiacus muntjak]
MALWNATCLDPLLYGILTEIGQPWHPRPLLELSDSNTMQLQEGPCLVLMAAKQLIQPIAEMIIARYKAKEKEVLPLFFYYTNLPEAALLLTILDMSARVTYMMDMEEITPAFVEAFVNDFLAE